MDIDFILSQADSRPMYQQVMGHIKDRVSVGDWPEGTKIPSIREMAVALKVSVITIKRAYQELEYEGVIAVRHGRGAFVAEQKTDSAIEREEELNRQLQQVVKLAAVLGISDDELQKRLARVRQNMMEKIQ